jgi:hemerythrin
MPWLPQYELGCTPMDDTHREFVEWINRLTEVPEGEFLASFDQFLAHTVAHFDQENLWMEKSGFPPSTVTWTSTSGYSPPCKVSAAW